LEGSPDRLGQQDLRAVRAIKVKLGLWAQMDLQEYLVPQAWQGPRALPGSSDHWDQSAFLDLLDFSDRLAQLALRVSRDHVVLPEGLVPPGQPEPWDRLATMDSVDLREDSVGQDLPGQRVTRDQTGQQDLSVGQGRQDLRVTPVRLGLRVRKETGDLRDRPGTQAG